VAWRTVLEAMGHMNKEAANIKQRFDKDLKGAKER
jgi:hypothetical protein